MTMYAAVWLLAGCATLRHPATKAIQRERPNIILVMADDVGVEAFGCYGGTSYETPNIDAIAGSGVRFTQCHSQPLCTPSRIKLMTGRSNIYNYSDFSILDPAEPTFGRMMQEAGYATCVAGKWQLLGAEHYGELAGTGTHPNQAGFDEYCLWQIDRVGSRYWDPTIEQNGVVLEGVADRYGPDVFCEFLCDFMERHKDRPFFAYYPMAMVHDPFVPTPGSADRGGKDKQRNFADMMSHMDRIVGRLADHLDRLGLRKNTIFIFTADNGTHRSITSNRDGTPVRGGKRLTTDAGTHVPLVVDWPNDAASGTVCDDLIDFSDFLPTLAEAAGADPASTGLTPHGRSFLPQIEGEAGDPRDWIFCYYNPRPGRKAWPEYRFARDERWKLYDDGRLFDLNNDAMEERPIEDNGQGVVAAAARVRLRAVIDSFPDGPLKIRKP